MCQRIKLFLLLVFLDQTISIAQSGEDLIVETIKATPDQLSQQSYLEQLEELYVNPQDLNKISEEQLRSYPFLSQMQADEIIDYRKESGPILHIVELQILASMDHKTLERMGKAFYVKRPRSAKELVKPDRSFISIRAMKHLQKKRGFTSSQENGGFTGSPYGNRIRVLHRKFGHYSFGLLMDKDPGEGNSMITSNLPTDFLTAHAFYEGDKSIKKICIGDFIIQSGEGLVFSQGFSLGKGGETIYSIKKPEPGIRPFTSAFEIGGYRGAVLEVSKLGLNISGFISKKTQNASMFLSYDSVQSISSVNQTGLHRNQSEKEKKGVFSETVVGGILQKKLLRNSLDVKLHYKNTQYSIPFMPRFSRPGYQFSGRDLTNWGVSSSFKKHNYFGFGELAFSSTNGYGLILGSIIQLNSKWETGLQGRSLSQKFHNPEANPFREGNQSRNENGLYYSLKYSPTHKWSLEGFIDIFTFPFPSNLNSEPHNGREYLLHFKMKPDKETFIRVLVRNELRGMFHGEANFLRQKAYIALDKKVSEELTWQSRIHFNRYRNLRDFTGFGATQEIRYTKRYFQFTALFGYFDTESFETRLFFFEKNVFGEYQVPSFSGQGLRHMFMIKVIPTRKLTFWLRIAQTTYFNKNEIGSGMDKIQGNKITEAKLMIKYSLF